MKQFGGPVLFLDRSDINTDEVIPAKYLNEISKEALAPYLFEDLKLDVLENRAERLQKASVVAARSNFGCGSSREHAVWALEVNNISVVIAESCARIFRQNMFNCGMMAIELPRNIIEKIFTFAERKDVVCEIDAGKKELVFTGKEQELVRLDYSISKFDEALVKEGGWVEYADAHY